MTFSDSKFCQRFSGIYRLACCGALVLTCNGSLAQISQSNYWKFRTAIETHGFGARVPTTSYGFRQ